MPATADDIKYRSESDARTMKEAEMIKKDPKRMKAAMGLMKEEMAALHEVMGSPEDMEKQAKGRFKGTYKEEKKEA